MALAYSCAIQHQLGAHADDPVKQSSDAHRSAPCARYTAAASMLPWVVASLHKRLANLALDLDVHTGKEGANEDLGDIAPWLLLCLLMVISDCG